MQIRRESLYIPYYRHISYISVRKPLQIFAVFLMYSFSWHPACLQKRRGCQTRRVEATTTLQNIIEHHVREYPLGAAPADYFCFSAAASVAAACSAAASLAATSSAAAFLAAASSLAAAFLASLASFSALSSLCLRALALSMSSACVRMAFSYGVRRFLLGSSSGTSSRPLPLPLLRNFVIKPERFWTWASDVCSCAYIPRSLVEKTTSIVEMMTTIYQNFWRWILKWNNSVAWTCTMSRIWRAYLCTRIWFGQRAWIMLWGRTKKKSAQDRRSQPSTNVYWYTYEGNRLHPNYRQCSYEQAKDKRACSHANHNVFVCERKLTMDCLSLGETMIANLLFYTPSRVTQQTKRLMMGGNQ